MSFQNRKLFLILSIGLIFLVENTNTQLTCLTIDQTLNNITNFATADPNATINVNGNYLNISYCVDVVNWPISNETFYNWSYYDQGIYFFLKHIKKFEKYGKIWKNKKFFAIFFGFSLLFLKNNL